MKAYSEHVKRLLIHNKLGIALGVILSLALMILGFIEVKSGEV